MDGSAIRSQRGFKMSSTAGQVGKWVWVDESWIWRSFNTWLHFPHGSLENTTLEVSLSSVPLVIACEGCTEAQMIGPNTNWNMMGDYIFLEEGERYWVSPRLSMCHSLSHSISKELCKADIWMPILQERKQKLTKHKQFSWGHWDSKQRSDDPWASRKRRPVGQWPFESGSHECG